MGRSLLLAFAALVLCAVPAAGQPSAIPDASGMKPVAGAPYILFDSLRSPPPAGLPDWHAHYEALGREFAERAREVDAVVTAAQPADRLMDELEYILPSHPRYREYERARETVTAAWKRQEELGAAYSAREDELLNPLVPALLDDLERFARERGYASVPIFQHFYADVLESVGMKEVSAEFVAWRAAQGG